MRDLDGVLGNARELNLFKLVQSLLMKRESRNLPLEKIEFGKPLVERIGMSLAYCTGQNSNGAVDSHTIQWLTEGGFEYIPDLWDATGGINGPVDWIFTQ